MSVTVSFFLTSVGTHRKTKQSNRVSCTVKCSIITHTSIIYNDDIANANVDSAKVKTPPTPRRPRNMAKAANIQTEVKVGTNSSTCNNGKASTAQNGKEVSDSADDSNICRGKSRKQSANTNSGANSTKTSPRVKPANSRGLGTTDHNANRASCSSTSSSLPCAENRVDGRPNEQDAAHKESVSPAQEPNDNSPSSSSQTRSA